MEYFQKTPLIRYICLLEKGMNKKERNELQAQLLINYKRESATSGACRVEPKIEQRINKS